MECCRDDGVIREGKLTVDAAMVGDGWYCGRRRQRPRLGRAGWQRSFIDAASEHALSSFITKARARGDGDPGMTQWQQRARVGVGGQCAARGTPREGQEGGSGTLVCVRGTQSSRCALVLMVHNRAQVQRKPTGDLVPFSPRRVLPRFVNPRIGSKLPGFSI
jgi:hypothetical protein